MKRNIDKIFLDWKDKKTRKPLIVRGTRQVGKSWSITNLGEQYFRKPPIIINLEKNPDLHVIFSKNLDAIRIKSDLELLLNRKITPGECLLFFDEIQECPAAILSLRYFYEQIPDLHVIAAGSLLEFALKNISFPVGRVQLLNMYPLNFHEFLLANGNDIIAETILKEPQKHTEPVHNLIRDELKKYFLIGGMPECVKKYAETNSYEEVFQIQNDLIATFRQDFSKYSGHSDKDCLNQVLNSVPQMVGNQIKYSQLSENFTTPTIKKAFELLETARLFKKVKASSPAGTPLGASINQTKFKSIFVDIGLFSRINNFTVSIDFFKQDLLHLFKGALAEQFVGQEIVSTGQEELYYWSREKKSSTAEVDFLVEKHGEIFPVEVKSGSAGSLKSLHLLMEKYKNIQCAYIFSDQQFGEIKEQKLFFLPLYYAYSVLKPNHPD